MQIYYDEGPPSVVMGAAGVFQKGVSREVDDKLAKQILEKKTIVFTEGERKAPATEPAAGKKKEVTNGSN